MVEYARSTAAAVAAVAAAATVTAVTSMPAVAAATGAVLPPGSTLAAPAPSMPVAAVMVIAGCVAM
jgi:hypothetical protein